METLLFLSGRVFREMVIAASLREVFAKPDIVQKDGFA